MIRLSVLLRCFVLSAVGLALSGCVPAASSNLDEQKEHHFLSGRSRVNSQDYAGAIEQFEKALEVNPRSASAHFELAWLNEEQKKDYAAAIYHYEQHLRIKPDSEYAERARERVRACKMDLAKSEMLSPIIQGLESDLRRLAAENSNLKRQLETLQGQLASRGPAASNQSPVPPRPNVVSPAEPLATSPQEPVAYAAPPSRSRQHVVKAGETLYSIARQYGIHPNKLQAANPGVDPPRLKPRQTLNIPAP